jgi:hypothetical protein
LVYRRRLLPILDWLDQNAVLSVDMLLSILGPSFPLTPIVLHIQQLAFWGFITSEEISPTLGSTVSITEGGSELLMDAMSTGRWVREFLVVRRSPPDPSDPRGPTT